MASESVDDLVDLLLSILALNSLPDVVEQNLRDNMITKRSFMLLDDTDLQQLGFMMGPRKLLVDWLKCQAARDNGSRTLEYEIPTLTSTPVRSEIAEDGPSPSSSSASHSRNTVSLSRVTKFKNCPVDDIISKQTKGAVNGPELVRKLKNGSVYTKQERMFFVKTVSKYLMHNSDIQDRPSKYEKIDMAQSIISTFPVLKDGVTGGFEEFYDPIAQTGSMEYFIRTKRSRSNDIECLWKVQRKEPRRLDLDSSTLTRESLDQDTDEVRLLRERRPNASNRVDLLELMDKTRDERRAWIEDAKPSITEILRRYPRFQDIDTAIKEEFRAMKPNSRPLIIEWQARRDKILLLADRSPSTSSMVADLASASEDQKSETAFKCVVAMLPVGPKRGIKRARAIPTSSIEDFFIRFENTTVEEAVNSMRESGRLQPCLFWAQDMYFFKSDNTAIPLPSASCFAEAVELTFMSFWVFAVEYPQSLTLFYRFLEHLVGIINQNLGAALRDFCRDLERE